MSSEWQSGESAQGQELGDPQLCVEFWLVLQPNILCHWLRVCYLLSAMSLFRMALQPEQLYAWHPGSVDGWWWWAWGSWQGWACLTPGTLQWMAPPRVGISPFSSAFPGPRTGSHLVGRIRNPMCRTHSKRKMGAPCSK